MNGKDLKLRRIAADVKAIDLAAVMRVSPSHVSRLENSRLLTQEAIDRYVAALATLTTESTSPTPVEAA